MTPRRRFGALLAGLAAALVGHRVFQWRGAPGWVLVSVGVAVVLFVAVVSVRTWRAADPGRRSVEGVQAAAHVAVAVALLALLAGTEVGLERLGVEIADPFVELRLRRGVLTIASILMAVGLLPGAAAAWMASLHGGHGVGADRIAAQRVRSTASAALDVVLAGSFLMVAGYVTAAHDRVVDASYFRTSSPGDAVAELVRGEPGELRVVLFFPEPNAVADEVEGYFRALAVTTGSVVVETHDPVANPSIARRYEVEDDGIVVIQRGERRERIGLPIDLENARAGLRVLDGTVHRALLRLAREDMVAYLTTGHGERADPSGAASAMSDTGDRPLAVLRAVLERQGFVVRDIGLGRGLGEAVPDDAAVLLVVGPERSFLDAELDAVDRYLSGGGSLLLALEPDTDFDPGPLRKHIGYENVGVALVDDRRYVRRRGGPADRLWIVTNRLSPHPAVATAARGGATSGILFAEAGHLRAIDDAEGVTSTVVIESMSSTFADLDGDLGFDPSTERRGGYTLAAAVSRALEDGREMRALVYADADLFSDAALSSLAGNAALVSDAVRWLGRDEAFSGTVESEADVPMVHTRAEDVAWFYTIILGAPLLVLVVGLFRLFGPRLPWKRSEA